MKFPVHVLIPLVAALTVRADDLNLPMRPAVLPGNGLAQHSFLYTGEWDHRGDR